LSLGGSADGGGFSPGCFFSFIRVNLKVVARVNLNVAEPGVGVQEKDRTKLLGAPKLRSDGV